MKANVKKEATEKDSEWLMQLYDTYYGVMKRKVFDMLGDTIDADDLIHETIIDLQKNINEVKRLGEESKNVLASYIISSLEINVYGFAKEKGIELFGEYAETSELESSEEESKK